MQSADIKVQVCIFAFDLLYLNGEVKKVLTCQALVTRPFMERRARLHQSFNEIEGEFSFAKSMTGTNIEEIQAFLDESVSGESTCLIIGNCEGLMVKTLEKEASYEPSKRSRNWLKVFLCNHDRLKRIT